MASKKAEGNVFKAASEGLRRWLKVAREKVMTPWRNFKGQPDPVAIYSTVPVWQAEVDRILAALTPALREGWAAANLPGDYDPSDPYIQANLALTKNLLVRIPDEVHALVIAQILEGSDAGESVEAIAERVDNVLNYTGSENWENRARVISVTETTRHRNGSALAHALLNEKQRNVSLTKGWDTNMDGRERPAHREANGHPAIPLHQPFIVGGEELLFPGDPRGLPENVIGCRCDLVIVNAVRA